MCLSIHIKYNVSVKNTTVLLHKHAILGQHVSTFSESSSGPLGYRYRTFSQSLSQDLHLCSHGKHSAAECRQRSTTSQADTCTIDAMLHHR